MSAVWLTQCTAGAFQYFVFLAGVEGNQCSIMLSGCRAPVQYAVATLADGFSAFSFWGSRYLNLDSEDTVAAVRSSFAMIMIPGLEIIFIHSFHNDDYSSSVMIPLVD